MAQVPGSLLSTCYPYVSMPSWDDALLTLVAQPRVNGDSIHHRGMEEDDAPIVLVKGPKRSGKSAVAKAALNALLTQYERVAWLECDLGQGEFGCGGVVGLWVIDQPIFGMSLARCNRSPQNRTKSLIIRSTLHTSSIT